MQLLAKLVSFLSNEDTSLERQAFSRNVTLTPPLPQPLSFPGVPAQGSTSAELPPEVQEELGRYQYALTPCTRPLAAFRPWCIPVMSEPSARARQTDLYAWLQPFLSTKVVECSSLDQVLQRGVASAKSIPPALRLLIRQKRKTKEHHPELLQALYGACVLVDLIESLRVESQTFFHDVAHFVDFDDLLTMRCDYTRMGYRRVQALKPTDIKWLVSEFGEPNIHLSYQPLWESLRRDAVRRYSRAEVSRTNNRVQTEGEIEAALPAWLQGRIEFSVRLRAEDRSRAAAALERSRQRDAALESLENVWKSTHFDFVVADLETTGLDSTSCEILELAAVLSDSTGTIVSEFSTLVSVEKTVPAFITDLTGISQHDIDQHGCPPQEALTAFLAFIGDRPVFFHNAPFDIAFLERATRQYDLTFSNVVYDTLPLARAVWPEMRSHKLETLAKAINAVPVPSHRALADAKTALSVLLAAREDAGYEGAKQP